MNLIYFLDAEERAALGYLKQAEVLLVGLIMYLESAIFCLCLYWLSYAAVASTSS